MKFSARALPCLASITLFLLLTACTMKPKPLTFEQMSQSAENDLTEMFKSGEPLTAPLTESDAIARVLKYNLDSRAKLMEEALALNQAKVDRWDMLPRLAANAGYNYRSEYDATTSQDLYDPTAEPDSPSYSSDRDQFTADLGLSWNVLDFGLSYFNAKQNADRALIATERKRKAVHNLVQETRFVFWRAAAHQALEGEVAKVVTEAREALAKAKIVEKENLKAPVENLSYQKMLLETLRQLTAIQQELSTAEIELAALINLPPGTPIKLAVPAEMAIPAWNINLERMEQLAFINNADLREQGYQDRISVNETRKAIARMFPGITLTTSQNYDHNSFLVENQWYEAGARMSWNLMNLVSGPDAIKYARTGEGVAKARRLAVRMAVLAQVHLAERQFNNSISQYRQADEVWQIDRKLSELSAARTANDAQGVFERVAGKTSAITSQLRCYQMFAQVEQAFARMQVSIGHDLLPDQLASHDLPALSAVIKERLESWGTDDGAAVDLAITEVGGKPAPPHTEVEKDDTHMDREPRQDLL